MRLVVLAFATPFIILMIPGLPHNAILGTWVLIAFVCAILVMCFEAAHYIAGLVSRRHSTRARAVLEEMEYAGTRNAKQNIEGRNRQ